MQAFEYVLGLASIVVGLALAEIASSLHRLLRVRQLVRWHWHAVVATAIVVLLALDVWWGLRQLERTGVTLTIGLFLPLLLTLLTFYLLAATALPDEIPQQGIELQAYYTANGAYFWSLFAMFVTLGIIHMGIIAFPTLSVDGAERFALRQIPNLAVLLVALSLARFRQHWWHSAALVLLSGALLLSYITRPLN